MIEQLSLTEVPDDLATLVADGRTVSFNFVHQQTYLQSGGPLKLQVALTNTMGKFSCLVAEHLADADDFESLADLTKQKPICLGEPLSLDPVYIPKPWGQEIWFSGIEERGISTCNGVPIAWVLDIFGKHLGCASAPLLLKILDPVPDENIGDLYFELHEKKVEVYIVTHVDKKAWPDGIGKIRYGFNQELMSQYENQDSFLNEYRNAVANYEQVRRVIDAGENGLEAEEQALREAMYHFTSMKDIREGDVITVEPFVPHSLQHGVRVVEFQTPHYERYILSFGQQVVTQDHWDTEEAIKLAKLDADSFASIDKDVIADFDEFVVKRIELEPDQSTTLNAEHYQLTIGVAGELTIEDTELTITAEVSHLIPSHHRLKLANHSNKTASVLVAWEK